MYALDLELSCMGLHNYKKLAGLSSMLICIAIGMLMEIESSRPIQQKQ